MLHENSNKIALFIDGANLYATAKTLGVDIDYKRLLQKSGPPELTWGASRRLRPLCWLLRGEAIATLAGALPYGPLFDKANAEAFDATPNLNGPYGTSSGIMLAVRIEILISGADEAVRDLVANSIKMAVDGLTGGVAK